MKSGTIYDFPVRVDLWIEYPGGISIAGHRPFEIDGSLLSENADIEAEGIAAQDCYPSQPEDRVNTGLVILPC